MLKRTEEQPLPGPWETLKASKRGFKQVRAYKHTDETQLAIIQLCMVGSIITGCMLILLFVLQNSVAVLVNICLPLLWPFLHIFWVLLHILCRSTSFFEEMIVMPIYPIYY